MKHKRPFWMHQMVEYILGGMLVAQGLQSPTPILPALAGGLIMVNAAIVRGPLAAFRVVSRRQHRTLDIVVIITVIVLGVQPAVSVEGSTRMIMVAMAVVMAFVWIGSNFDDRVKRSARTKITAEGGRGTEVGRLAGRAVGDGINAAKRMKDARKR